MWVAISPCGKVIWQAEAVQKARRYSGVDPSRQTLWGQRQGPLTCSQIPPSMLILSQLTKDGFDLESGNRRQAP